MTNEELTERVIRLEECQRKIIEHRGILDSLASQLEQGIRPRIHNLNDELQLHRLSIKEHDIVLGMLKTDIALMRATAATREQLETGLKSVGEKIENVHTQTDLKLDAIKETLDPLKRGIYWVVTVIVGAVILAVIGLALRGGKP